MDFLGLEYRRVDSTERQYSTTTETKKAERGDKSSTNEGDTIDGEAVDADVDPKAQIADKIQRAYLPNNSGNKPIRYLA